MLGEAIVLILLYLCHPRPVNSFLKIEDIDINPSMNNNIHVRIHALGLNRADAMFRSGQYLEEPKFPARPGYEAAGTVAAIGTGVQDFKIGDAVSTIPSSC